MDIEAVVFDIDGTLYPNYRMYLHSLQFGFRKPVLLRHFSSIRKTIRTIRPIENFRLLQAELLAGRMQIDTGRAYELIDHWIYHHWEGSLHRIRPFPYVKEVLAEFRRGGLKLGVLSDYPVERKLEFLGLDFPWDCALSSEDTGYLKPNPEPFLEVASRLNLPPERILYVGNSYEYDILGARGVGMHTAHLCRRPRQGSVAEIEFYDFRKLLEVNLAGVHA